MPKNDKSNVLHEEGTLNPRPEGVSDPKFSPGDFFDPRDLVQVKYEMLRRVRTDAVPVTQAVTEFGFSRPTYYDAKSLFEQEGIAGLVPKKRGPRGPHKLRGEVMAFLREQTVPNQPIQARQLAAQIQERFGIDVHPRSIERALRKKKPG